MELTKQVVSLELAKRLKELGVVQKSLFYWVDDGEATIHDWTVVKDSWSEKTLKFSAFTVAELGDMLPDYTQELGNLEISKCDTDHFNMQRKEKRWWNVSYWTWKNAYSKSGDIYLERESKHLQQADTEADARAKCLIYLLENNLTPSQETNI